MSHHCHARGCEQPVKAELLMCLEHWKKVPHVVRLAVWRHYRPGQCDDKEPSREWHDAADAAIAAVAIREGRAITKSELVALESFEDAEGHEGAIFDLLVKHGDRERVPTQMRLFK